MTKLLTSVQPNIIEYDDGNCSTSFQHKVHMSPSVPQIILPEVPVPPPRVQTAQSPMVDTEGPSSNLRSRGKKNTIPKFALTAQFQIKYLEFPRNTDIWSKAQTGKFGKDHFQMNWDSYPRVSEWQKVQIQLFSFPKQKSQNIKN